jgi:hypothetical protein
MNRTNRRPKLVCTMRMNVNDAVGVGAPMIVTPVSSRDDNKAEWLSQIESGVVLSDADWELLSKDRVSVVCMTSCDESERRE